MTNQETIQFAANFMFDCTNHVAHFIVAFDTTGMTDHRDLEYAMEKHAKAYMASTNWDTDQMVTFDGVRTDWKRASVAPAAGAFFK